MTPGSVSVCRSQPPTSLSQSNTVSRRRRLDRNRKQTQLDATNNNSPILAAKVVIKHDMLPVHSSVGIAFIPYIAAAYMGQRESKKMDFYRATLCIARS